MNKQIERHIAKALYESTNSDYHRIRIGCVIARGNKEVGAGHNVRKGHPFQRICNLAVARQTRCDSMHAETMAVLYTSPSLVRGSTVFVGRYERNGRLGNCRPCPACEKLLRESGVQKVYYTDTTGIKELIL